MDGLLINAWTLSLGGSRSLSLFCVCVFVCVYTYVWYVCGQARERHWASSITLHLIPLRHDLSWNLELIYHLASLGSQQVSGIYLSLSSRSGVTSLGSQPISHFYLGTIDPSSGPYTCVANDLTHHLSHLSSSCLLIMISCHWYESCITSNHMWPKYCLELLQRKESLLWRWDYASNSVFYYSNCRRVDGLNFSSLPYSIANS